MLLILTGMDTKKTKMKTKLTNGKTCDKG